MENADNNLNNEKREDLDIMPNGKRKQSFYPKSTNMPKNYPKQKYAPSQKKYTNFPGSKKKSSSGLGMMAGLFVLLGIIIATNPFFADIVGRTMAFTIGLIVIIVGMVIFGASL
jgi:hypothetical protein